MNKHNPSGKRVKSRPGRREVVAAKRAAAAMMSVEEMAAILGVGRNQAYALLHEKQVPALRFGRRWLVSRRIVERLVNGEAVAAAS